MKVVIDLTRVMEITAGSIAVPIAVLPMPERTRALVIFLVALVYFVVSAFKYWSRIRQFKSFGIHPPLAVYSFLALSVVGILSFVVTLAVAFWNIKAPILTVLPSYIFAYIFMLTALETEGRATSEYTRRKTDHTTIAIVRDRRRAILKKDKDDNER